MASSSGYHPRSSLGIQEEVATLPITLQATVLSRAIYEQFDIG
jgi:hypothetical protein